MARGKLDKPPYAHNWVRYIYPEIGKTTRALVGFARGMPTTSYSAASPIIRDRVLMGLDRETAMTAARTTGRQNSREIVAEYVGAFFDYDETRRYYGKPCFDEIVEPFRAGKGILVPVKPLVTIVESGKLVPIFSVGWASMPLNLWQRRLLATVMEDAVFSLTDFRNSPGEFLCFPRRECEDGDTVREPLVWKRGDFDLLSKDELRDCLEMYLSALDAAKKILAADKAPDKKPRRPDDDTHPRLF